MSTSTRARTFAIVRSRGGVVVWACNEKRKGTCGQNSDGAGCAAGKKEMKTDARLVRKWIQPGREAQD